jgi:hypothetical protein
VYRFRITNAAFIVMDREKKERRKLKGGMDIEIWKDAYKWTE